MTQSALLSLALISTVWLGWIGCSLSSIAEDIRALRKLARKEP
ncbi:hypothetical protein [Novosphingobium sp. HII-3]|nr:hypothetical protein [Novosphingobium sp. HII-3]